jgi:hypothetical protein
MHRLEGARTALSRTRLPLRPVLEWKHHVLGGIAVPPVVLEDGSTVVATRFGHMVRVNARGLPDWRVDTGSSAMVPPALLSDGTIVVLTASSEVIGLDGEGARRFTRRLFDHPKGWASLLPLPDGSVVLATGNLMLHLGPTGRIRRQTALPAPVAALLSHRSLPVVVTRTGEVLSWRPDGHLADLGSFRASIRAGAVRSGSQLLAPTADGQLTQVDLTTRGRSQRWRGVGRVRLVQLPAVRESGSLVALSADGFLLVEPSASKDPERIALLDSPNDAAKAGKASLWLPPVVDRHGTTAFAAADVGVGVVHSDGTVRYASGTTCRSPLGLVPSGSGRLILACRSGLLMSLRDGGAGS